VSGDVNAIDGSAAMRQLKKKSNHKFNHIPEWGMIGTPIIAIGTGKKQHV
jgi:hypothetical protein